ncbi:MAG: DUF559 domain-containing protein [Phycisphaeraceae bacterium]|nr:DUF559 domain-containing protein [Phycisphaeraceae bacterium]
MLIRRTKSSPASTARARTLRRESSAPERVLWRWLRGRRLGGFKFRRQQPLGGYTLDFFCREAMLCVELDGVHHAGETNRLRDSVRDAKLAELGVRTLRFTASSLAKERDAVLATILREARPRATATADDAPPSPAGRRCLAQPDG